MIRVIDIETTGLTFPEAQVCEIGWSVVKEVPERGWVVEHPGAQLVNPGISIPPEISAVHHLVDKDVAGEPLLSQIVEDMGSDEGVEFYAAHRSSFELSFLGGLEPFRLKPWICTWKVAIHLAPKAPSHSNQALRYWLGLDLDHSLAMPPHRAGPDAFVTAHILRRMLAKLSPQEMAEISSRPAILPRLGFGMHAKAALEDVPESYLDWILKQKDMDPDARATATHHLQLRRG